MSVTFLRYSLLSLALSSCFTASSAFAVDDYSLRILHVNDNHSHLEPNSMKLKFGENKVKVKTGGYAAVASEIKALSAQGGNVLKLHAGDALTGTLYFTLFEGRADADVMKQVCFDVFELGNHEFDRGDKTLATFLQNLTSGQCKTDVLAANVAPAVATPLMPKEGESFIKPYTIKDIGGEKIGIIGVVIAGKTKNSSSPDPTTAFLPELETAQKYIDELSKQGVNKIVLLSHFGYQNDLSLAKALKGIDVIIGGDSHSLLGKGFEQYGLSPEGDYPTVAQNADGKTTCVVQAWQYSDVVGELNVSFDKDGNVSQCGGTPHLLLGSKFEQDDKELTGDALEAVKKMIAADSALSMVEPDADTQKIIADYKTQVDKLKNEVVGKASEDLCLDRIPSPTGKSTLESCKGKTNEHGSDISNIVSKGFLMMSKTSDICLQNAGGVRTDVPKGNITIDTAYTLLPFANTLVELELSGQQILDVLEESTDFALDEKGSTGSYPYASGLRWQVDLAQPFGKRFSQVEINSRLKGEWTAIDPKATYKVVTNNYLASGKDGYLTFGDLAADKKVDTFLDYAQSFVDYVKSEAAAGHEISKLPLTEYSTQGCKPDAKGLYCTAK